MKSYINQLADYRDVPFEKEVVIQCPKEYIDTQMRHLTRKYKKNEPVKVLEKGDVAVLSLESGLERFNRPTVMITVGGGIFHKEFEEQLLGHPVGESFEVSADGEAVKVTVKQATRTVFPEPTDEMAADYARDHDDFAECTTLEAYRNRIIQDYYEDKRREVLYGRLDAILEYVLTKSDWEFDEEELQAYVSEAMKEVSRELKEQGKSLESLSSEELQNFFGIDSAEEIGTVIRGEAEQRIATALWFASLTGQDIKEASLEELEETQDWTFLEEYVKEDLIIKEEK